MDAMKKRLRQIWDFYYEGFTSMGSVARLLWLIVAVKLFIMFAVLKLFFFPSALAQYDTEQEKTEAVISNLTDEVKN